MGSGEFINLLMSLLSIKDRRVQCSNHSTIGGISYSAVYVNFINLPKDIGSAGGGAEAENNRSSFWIRGFGKESPESVPPTGKVKIEQANTVLPREMRMRSKTASPEKIAEYLANYLNKVVKEVEPNFTHSKR
jgi:hypothetical protein